MEEKLKKLIEAIVQMSGKEFEGFEQEVRELRPKNAEDAEGE